MSDDTVTRLRASIAAHESWSRTTDRSARTAPARAALMARFEREVDPDGTLPPDERARRADHKRRAYFGRLALKSARSRRRAVALRAEGEAAEVELAALVGEPPGRARPSIRRTTCAETVSQPRPKTLTPDGGRAA